LVFQRARVGWEEFVWILLDWKPVGGIRQRVIIVGGGFASLNAAKGLSGASAPSSF
jgi:hypothetical protein